MLLRIHNLGGHELHPEWGDLPWRVLADPSGNEFCLLPAPSGQGNYSSRRITTRRGVGRLT